MKAKITTTLLILSGLIAAICIYPHWNVNPQSDQKAPFHPRPFETEFDANNPDGQLINYRAKWEDRIHGNDIHSNWRSIELSNKQSLKQHKNSLNELVDFRLSDEYIGGGRLVGNWKENGSTSLAGSVIASAYDSLRQDIYLISAGGSIFRGDLYGKTNINWRVMDDDRKYDGYILKTLYPAKGGLRIFTAPNGIPSYTDNRGTIWKKPRGLPTSNKGKKYAFDFIQTKNNQLYIILKTNANNTEYKIYHSTDLGESFRSFHTFYANDEKDFKLMVPENDNRLLFIQKKGDSDVISYIYNKTIRQIFTQLPYFGKTRRNIVGCKHNNKTYLYIYTIDKATQKATIHRSIDGGSNWSVRGKTRELPFRAGLFVFPNNPNKILLGGIECLISNDGGLSFYSKNKWQNYYKDPKSQLHADMMYFKYIHNENGAPFLLVSNHGGIYISYDDLQSCTNIALNNLNVSQYYSINTNPFYPKYTFAGSQDQGIQRATKIGSKYKFNQLLSGDYGDVLFTERGKNMWSIAPGGTVYFWDKPYSISKTKVSFYNTYSDEKKVWIPQIVQSYNQDENAIFIARNDHTKDINTGGIPYSHILKVSYNKNRAVGKKFESKPYPYNFTSNSNGGELSTFAFDPSQSNKWIAGTTNGYIFYSSNYGANWKKSTFTSTNNKRQFYIQKLVFSKEKNKVFAVGGGYESTPILISHDGGKSFESMKYNLPATTIFDLVEVEDLLFIATENGPWVFFSKLNEWHTLSGFYGPLQSYRDIEYIQKNGEKIVRFATFGRGIWDFNINKINIVGTDKITNTQSIKAFPNPASDYIQFDLPSSTIYNVSIYSLDGGLIMNSSINKNTKLNISYLKKGTYMIHLSDKQFNFVSKIIKY